MMRGTNVVVTASAVVLAALVGVACGDSTSGEGGATGSTTTGASGSTKASTGSSVPGSCTQPGDKGNDKGVGEFCMPGGSECAAFPGAPVCLATLQEPEWMCTRIGCKQASDCGMNAGCLKTPDGSACVPCRCDDTSEGCPNGPMSTSSSSGSGTASSSGSGL